MLTPDVTGHLWCEHCEMQRTLIDLGAKIGYPVLSITWRGQKSKVSPGTEKWLKFARTAGHTLVQIALEVAREMEDAAIA